MPKKYKSLTPRKAAKELWLIKTEEDMIKQEMKSAKCQICKSSNVKLYDIKGKYGVQCRKCGASSKKLYMLSEEAYKSFSLGEVYDGSTGPVIKRG